MARLLLCLVTVCAASACAPLATHGTATIPHPGRAALRADATQIALPDTARELQLGLTRGTLTDRAALTEASAERVCVQVALFATPGDDGRSRLSSYDAKLVVAGPSGGREVGGAVLEREQSWTETRNASRFNRWTGYRSQYPLPVRYRAAHVCFRDDALVTDATEELRLVLRRDGRVRAFAWRLGAGAAYPEGAGDGSDMHPLPHDPPPQNAAPGRYAMRASAGTGLTAVSVPIDRTPGGHPVDAEQIRQLLEARFGLLRQCLSREAERDAQLAQMQGSMIAELTIGPSGVRNVRVVANDFTAGAAACMERHLNELPVPADPLRWTAAFRYGITTHAPNGGNR